MSILQYLLSSISLLWHVDHASHYQYMMSSLSSWWQHPIPSRVAGTKCNGFDLPFFPWQSCRACLAASRLPSTWADEKCEERKQLCFKMLGKSEFHEVDRCRWHDMYSTLWNIFSDVGVQPRDTFQNVPNVSSKLWRQMTMNLANFTVGNRSIEREIYAWTTFFGKESI